MPVFGIRTGESGACTGSVFQYPDTVFSSSGQTDEQSRLRPARFWIRFSGGEFKRGKAPVHCNMSYRAWVNFSCAQRNEHKHD